MVLERAHIQVKDKQSIKCLLNHHYWEATVIKILKNEYFQAQ